MSPTLFTDIYYLNPEILITAFLVLVVLFDLFFPRKKSVLPFLTLIGLSAAMFFTGIQFYYPPPSVQTGFLSMLYFDPFGAFFKLLILMTSFFIVLMSAVSKEMEEAKDRHGEYYSLMLGMVLGMMTLISAKNFILLYLSVELVSLSSYVLAGFIKNSEKSSEASLKYIIYGGVASGVMLFGISLLYGMTGTFDFQGIARVLPGVILSFNPVLFVLTCLLIFTGIGFKISAVPFHFWTPDVYEGAPTSITAYLSVASKAAGFAALMRILGVLSFKINLDVHGLFTVFNWQQLIIYLSILTMTVGNFAALWQDNIKRMLAYSSIAHAGYILTAIAVFSDAGRVAVLLYFAIYMMMNLGAFLIVILISNKIGSENIDDYDGLGPKMPFYGIALAIFLVSLTGLPPTAGFIGKLYLFLALVDAKMITLAVIALLNSVVSLYYYIRVLKHMFLTKSRNEEQYGNVSFANTILVLLLVVPVLVFGIYFTPLVNLVKNATF